MDKVHFFHSTSYFVIKWCDPYEKLAVKCQIPIILSAGLVGDAIATMTILDKCPRNINILLGNLHVFQEEYFDTELIYVSNVNHLFTSA